MKDSVMKQLIKVLIPNFILIARRNYINARQCKANETLSPKEAFTMVYMDGLWGKSENPNQKFFSGTGSHAGDVVSTYVSAIETYLKSLERKPNVVDLGCGDFAVGSKIRRLCANYIACDVVEPLISYNVEKFKQLDVEFRVLDIIDSDLPDGDLVFIRQVLQHLSNKQISKLLPKLNKYKHIVLTEHLPASINFVANIDKPVGAGIRLGFGKYGSGVVLTELPFNFKVKTSAIMCEANEEGGIIRTTLYEMF